MERTRDGLRLRRGGAPARRRRGPSTPPSSARRALIRSIGTDDNRAPHTRRAPLRRRRPQDPRRFPGHPRRRRCSTGSSPRASACACASSSGRADAPRRRRGTPTWSATSRAAARPGEVVLLERAPRLVGSRSRRARRRRARRRHRDGGRAADRQAGRSTRAAPCASCSSPTRRTGLRGAIAYGAAHAGELAAHVLAMEADLGDGRVYEARLLGGPAAGPTFRTVAAAVAPLGAVLSSD